MRQIAAIASASDRGTGRERSVRADEQGVASVEAQVPDAAQAPAAAGRKRRVAEAIDEGAVEQLAVAAQLEHAVVGAVGEADALDADGQLALHRAVMGDDGMSVALVQDG